MASEMMIFGTTIQMLGCREMITEEEARAICLREINRSEGPESIEMVVTEISELPDAWVAYYQSREYMETGNFSAAVVGNGPFVICKNTGRFAALGTALPLEAQIKEALVRLRNQ